MEEAHQHHEIPVPARMPDSEVPTPDAAPAAWKNGLARAFGEDEETRWGRRMVRVAADAMLVCDESLRIRYHNRAFLRLIGYREGSYKGMSLYDFLPGKDRAEAEEVFAGFFESRTAGIRLNAPFLTLKGKREMDARISRTRVGEGKFLVYFVIRDDSSRAAMVRDLEDKSIEPILGGLPVAAFRTDRKLRVTHAFGSLWDDLGFASDSLLGADLSDQGGMAVPRFLHDIDYCDTMAGLTLHTEVTWKEMLFEVTVEPFVDEHRKGRVIGTLGLIRKAKRIPSDRAAEHLRFPDPEDYTRPLQATRKVETGPPSEEDEIARIRSSIRPRPLAPGDISPEAEREGDLALAN